MNYLRLIQDGKPQSEFYTDEFPINYLKNIKDLNIIIGANNTRKSRFMRKMINLEHKLIIRTKSEINHIFQNMETMFEGMEGNLLEVKLISFIFNNPQNPSLQYNEIKEYFSQQISDGGHLTFFDIQKSLKNILETINTVATQDQITPLKTIITRTYETLSLVQRIYENFQNFFNFSWDSANQTDIPGITYRIIAGFTGQIDDLEKKVGFLQSAVQYISVLRDLEIEPHHQDMMVYIPVLRTSRRLVGASADLYKKTIQQQYKMSDNSKLTIETGLDLYEKIEVARNGHRAERERFADFEKFISNVFFQSRPIDIIAVKSQSDTERHVKVSLDGEQDDIAIHDLGDGIQAVINLLLPVFTAIDGSWIFIDEPENHLHPGYQNIFMSAISSNETIRKKNLKFFINTHSNHLLSEAFLGNSDTEIFVFSRRDKDSSAIVTFDGNEYNTLEMLGVFNTSVLISNCTIWVEGITDRLYLKAFLFAYFNQEGTSKLVPVEGLNYSFIEYAGNNLLHYSFDHEMSSNKVDEDQGIKAFFINSNVFLLADSDFGKEEKHQFYKELEKRKNFKYFQTELPEIENLLPNSILKSWLINDLKCLDTEVEECFKTPINDQKLGAYFHEKFTYKNTKRKFMTPADGGTLRADLKKRLAQYVHNGIMDKSINWKDLQESAVIKKLILEIDNFVREKNLNNPIKFD